MHPRTGAEGAPEIPGAGEQAGAQDRVDARVKRGGRGPHPLQSESFLASDAITLKMSGVMSERIKTHPNQNESKVEYRFWGSPPSQRWPWALVQCNYERKERKMKPRLAPFCTLGAISFFAPPPVYSPP